MSEYNFPPVPARADSATMEAVDLDGELIGRFTMTYLDDNSARWTKIRMDAYKLLSPEDQKRCDRLKTVDDIEFNRAVTRKAVINHYLVNCEIVGADGKMLEPADQDEARKMALAFFSNPERADVFYEVHAFALSQGNFRRKSVEASKNA